MIQINTGVTLWHSVNGEGFLIKQLDRELVIEFKSGKRKHLSIDALGYSIFTDKAEINYTDYAYLEEKYGTSRKLTKYEPLENKEYSVSAIETGEMRAFVILCKKRKMLRKKAAFLILAVDVQSANIVRLVDTNGMENGLHTEQEWLNRINLLDVIYVMVKSTTKGNYHNSIRIVGEVQIVGQSNLKLLEKKYRNFIKISGYPNHNIKMNFQDFFALAHMHTGYETVGLVYFSNTEIRAGKEGKFQLKMGQVFADIEKDELSGDNFPLYYQGLALVTAFVSPGEHRARVRIEKLLSIPSKNVRIKEQEGPLMTLTRRFILGLELCRYVSFNIDKLRTALCDVDGNLTEEQGSLYQEALFLQETPFALWNSYQQKRFIDGTLFAALHEVCPNLDYITWMNQLYQPVTGISLMAEKLVENLIISGFEDEFLRYCSFVVSCSNSLVPEHRKKIYAEVIKEVERGIKRFEDEFQKEHEILNELEPFNNFKSQLSRW